MATTEQYDAVRADLDASTDALSDAYLADQYVKAEARYDDSAAIEAQVRLLAIRQLLAVAAKRRGYTQNGTVSDTQSPIFTALYQLRSLYQQDLQDALNAAYGIAQWGGLRRKPTRLEDYPDEYDG